VNIGCYFLISFPPTNVANSRELLRVCWTAVLISESTVKRCNSRLRWQSELWISVLLTEQGVTRCVAWLLELLTSLRILLSELATILGFDIDLSIEWMRCFQDEPWRLQPIYQVWAWHHICWRCWYAGSSENWGFEVDSRLQTCWVLKPFVSFFSVNITCFC
jgi:hypothetical protein